MANLLQFAMSFETKHDSNDGWEEVTDKRKVKREARKQDKLAEAAGPASKSAAVKTLKKEKIDHKAEKRRKEKALEKKKLKQREEDAALRRFDSADDLASVIELLFRQTPDDFLRISTIGDKLNVRTGLARVQ